MWSSLLTDTMQLSSIISAELHSSFLFCFCKLNQKPRKRKGSRFSVSWSSCRLSVYFSRYSSSPEGRLHLTVGKKEKKRQIWVGNKSTSKTVVIKSRLKYNIFHTRTDRIRMSATDHQVLKNLRPQALSCPSSLWIHNTLVFKKQLVLDEQSGT